MYSVVQPRYNPHKSTAVKPGAERTRKKDYHWMAWPSPSSTPQPSRPPSARPHSARSHVQSAKQPRQAPLSARPASKRELAAQMIPRPESAFTEPREAQVTLKQRPQSAIVRATTPRAPTPRAPTPRMHTPAPIRAESPSIPATPMTFDARDEIARLFNTQQQPNIAELQQSIAKGRPVSAYSYRSATPQFNRCQTPREFNPGYDDTVEAQARPPSATNPTYVPALKAWVSNANDYGRILMTCFTIVLAVQHISFLENMLNATICK